MIHVTGKEVKSSMCKQQLQAHEENSKHPNKKLNNQFIKRININRQ